MNARHPFLTFEQRGASLISESPDDTIFERLTRRSEQLEALLELTLADTPERLDAVHEQLKDRIESILCELAWEVISLRETVCSAERSS
jgi:hypothetical protein